MTSSISIAVCTYNGERFLQEQLDSLLAQTRHPDQLVIRDDASSDGTLALLRAFVPRAEALGIAVDLQVNSLNVGYRQNFDGALRACSGDLVFLCDQDDVWYPDKLQRFCAEFDARPELLALHSDAELIDGSGRMLSKRLFSALGYRPSEHARMHAGHGFELLLKRPLMTGAAMALRRRVLDDALPLPASGWVHDAWISMLAAMRGNIDSLPDPLIGYRLHGNNQVGLGDQDGVSREVRRERQLEIERLQCEQLLVRARALGLPGSRLEWIERKQRHLTVRTRLGPARLRRIPAVMAELLSGNYGYFGRGLLTAAIDLVRR
ncbi:TPA: glycosyltransferase family 2 protein [Stenotrophomonas maltophilia]|uniref:glycosyltransferase family 2 protein n=1 Tax=Stenotrophomonas maltophilia group TaxID=995085 RepID=UPI0015E01103|nr:glycosyltransferase family 2 protein [Stenotrophomonas maltophilia]MBA0434482.1 glycosyltransferase family 2 protein [Stenotrophomonas maltophilia]MDZ5816689.1 glycosyltransferase family 2 protein [Stenotrophomonas maltophilia]HEL3813780.1 glycosyltransferase family 2 protein [Stenotrophomonas maltophilia]